MSAIHVLDGDGDTYRVVAHTNTPVGNNAIGNSWASVLIAAGANTTTMTTGVGLGQISSDEAASIVAGSVVELVLSIVVPTNGTLAQKQSAMINGVSQKITDGLANLQAKYNYYGYTNG